MRNSIQSAAVILIAVLSCQGQAAILDCDLQVDGSEYNDNSQPVILGHGTIDSSKRGTVEIVDHLTTDSTPFTAAILNTGSELQIAFKQAGDTLPALGPAIVILPAHDFSRSAQIDRFAWREGISADEIVLHCSDGANRK